MIGAEGAAITSIETWRLHAAPKGGDAQWVDGRSAKELAKAWCATAPVEPPRDLARLLDSHQLTRGLCASEAYPELRTDLRGEARGPRVHDILIVGTTGRGRVVVGVEAKADEAFDRTLADRWAAAQRTLQAGNATNWPARLARLTPALFAAEATDAGGEFNQELSHIPYQLISALAGTLIEAERRRAVLAVLAVHVFATNRTRPEILAENKRVFSGFAAFVTESDPTEIVDGQLYGPFTVPGGGGIPSIPALIGSVTTTVA